MTRFRRLFYGVLLCAIAAVRCGGTPPTAPDKNPTPSITISCDSATGSVLNCRAPVSCGGSPCGGTTPSDVTASATWSIDDSSLAQMTAPGSIVALPTSFLIFRITNVRAQAPQMTSACQSIGVFPGVASPLPTFPLVGRVYTGLDPVSGAIKGAFVEVVTGLVAGVVAVTGSTFPCPICCTPPETPPPGTFVLDVPPGTIHLLIQAGGFQPLERDVTLTFSGGATVDFQLRPR